MRRSVVGFVFAAHPIAIDNLRGVGVVCVERECIVLDCNPDVNWSVEQLGNHPTDRIESCASFDAKTFPLSDMPDVQVCYDTRHIQICYWESSTYIHIVV